MTTKQRHQKTYTKDLVRLFTWQESIRRQIWLQSDTSFDSTAKEFYQNGSIHVDRRYKNNQPTSVITYNLNGRQSSEAYYAHDTAFKLQREICNDSDVIAETILYNNDTCGFFQHYNCDKTKEEEGFMYKNKRFGIWHYKNDKESVRIVDYKNHDLVDSLNLIQITAR